VRTAVVRAATQLQSAGVELSPGERLSFLYVRGPQRVVPWEQVQPSTVYDLPAYVDLLLRALESLFAPVGVDRATLELWLLGNAGYWGPPGVLPPPGVDGAAPLLAQARPLPGTRLRFPRRMPALPIPAPREAS